LWNGYRRGGKFHYFSFTHLDRGRGGGSGKKLRGLDFKCATHRIWSRAVQFNFAFELHFQRCLQARGIYTEVQIRCVKYCRSDYELNTAMSCADGIPHGNPAVKASEKAVCEGFSIIQQSSVNDATGI